jgi:hypothetical protein
VIRAMKGFMNRKYIGGMTAFLILLCFKVSPVKAEIIKFDSLDLGTPVLDQYSSFGVYFRDQLSLSGTAPGIIVASSLSPASALQPNAFDAPMYMIFSAPIYSFKLSKFEHVDQPPVEQPPQEEAQPTEAPPTEAPTESAPQEEYTVYFEFFKYNAGNYESLGGIHNSVKDIWTTMAYSSTDPISAVKIYGTNSYIADDIEYSYVTSVPEPAFLLLLGSGFGVIGFAVWCRKK